MVPADVRVVTAKDLFVTQSALTGESFTAEQKERFLRPMASGAAKRRAGTGSSGRSEAATRSKRPCPADAI